LTGVVQRTTSSTADSTSSGLHVVDRRGPANDLLDRRLDQLRILLELLELVGILEEGAHAADQRVLGRVVSGAEGDQVVADGLHHAHRLVVDRAVGEQAREVVAGVRAAVLDDLVEELVELETELEGGLLPILACALQVGVVEGEELVRESEDVGLALPRHAEHGREDAERVGGGDVVREVALPLAGFAGELVHELPGARVDDVVEGLDRPRREDGAGDLAIAAMLGRIHLDDHAHGAETLGALAQALLAFVEQDDAARRRELVGLLRDLADVGVLGDRPEGLEAGRLAAVHGGLGAEPRPEIVGNAFLGVGMAVNQVESVGDGHAMGSWVGAVRLDEV
jgi:hypothetical protein